MKVRGIPGFDELPSITHPFLVPVVALETIGSNSFHHTMVLNKYPTSNFPIPAVNKSENIHDEHSDVHLVAFHAFDSKASGSLGASTPAPGVVSMALHRSGPLTNVSIPDSLAMQTALNFASEFPHPQRSTAEA